MKHSVDVSTQPSTPPQPTSNDDSDQQLLALGLASREKDRMLTYAPDLWGYLQPYGGEESSIDYLDFPKDTKEYRIGLPVRSKRNGTIIGEHVIFGRGRIVMTVSERSKKI